MINKEVTKNSTEFNSSLIQAAMWLHQHYLRESAKLVIFSEIKIDITSQP